ncbi:MAG: hypothetical protein H7Y88_13500 [Phycisphaerales bacterium]|nr:hypothetical protein [Phycisphaerales bacterium]
MRAATRMSLGVALGCVVGVASLPLLAQPERTPSPPNTPAPKPANPEWPNRNEAKSTELVVPPGIYTSMVFVGVATQSEATAYTIKVGDVEYPVRVEGGHTLVVPFGDGWQLGQAGTIVVARPHPMMEYVAWGVTTSGPVRFNKKQ